MNPREKEWSVCVKGDEARRLPGTRSMKGPLCLI